MSTYYMVKMKEESHSYLFNDIAMELKRLEDKFSDYNKDSELYYLNKHGREGYFKVSDEMFSVIKDAINIAAKSKGCFDPTVGPLLELWGFKDKKLFFPKDREVERVLSSVGWENIELSKDNTVRFKDDKMSIDLGGIAKGYAIDSVISLLKSNGVKDAIVEIGGDMYCLGRGLDEGVWRVGVQDPKVENSVIAKIDISNSAVATSGSYERFLKNKDEKFSHIIDPRDGFPIKEKILSVTVVSPRAIDADGWATALLVMGVDMGKKIVEEESSLEAIFILEGEGGYDIWISTGLIDRVEIL